MGGIYIIRRKIIAAIVSSLFIALLTLFDGYSENLFFNSLFLNLLVAIVFGVLLSFCIDWFCGRVFKTIYLREGVSFVLHTCAGLAFMGIGALSAMLFFLVDRLLKPLKISWLAVIIALVMVAILFIYLINK
ncbi:MAG: hypothetical protein KBT36_01935 [Kurthia sp.]|nr:hypothetical protein [Candidatus Kurthia equi]